MSHSAVVWGPIIIHPYDCSVDHSKGHKGLRRPVTLNVVPRFILVLRRGGVVNVVLPFGRLLERGW